MSRAIITYFRPGDVRSVTPVNSSFASIQAASGSLSDASLREEGLDWWATESEVERKKIFTKITTDAKAAPTFSGGDMLSWQVLEISGTTFQTGAFAVEAGDLLHVQFCCQCPSGPGATDLGLDCPATPGAPVADTPKLEFKLEYRQTTGAVDVVPAWAVATWETGATDKRDTDAVIVDLVNQPVDFCVYLQAHLPYVSGGYDWVRVRVQQPQPSPWGGLECQIGYAVLCGSASRCRV